MTTTLDIFRAAIEHHNAGRLAEAEAGYDAVLQVWPDRPEALFNRGFAQQMQGKFVEAVQSYRHLLRVTPGFAGAHTKLGEVHHWLGRLGPALEHYRIALDLEPGNGEAQAGEQTVQALLNRRQACQEQLRAGGRVDLSDVTFMIPCRLESDDRRRNLGILLRYLRRHLNAAIIICEDTPSSAEVPAVAAAAGLEPGTYTHIHLTGNDTPYTHKAKQINLMAEAARTPILVVQDTDVLVEPWQYAPARDAVRAGAAMACPFNGLFFDVAADCVPLVSQHLSLTMVDLLDPRHTLLYKNSYAGSVFFHREVFTRFGGFNETFVSWGWEDFEIYRRLERLGLRVERLWGPTLHLNHGRTANSLKANPWYAANTREYDRVVALPREAILAEIAAGRFRRPLISTAVPAGWDAEATEEHA